MDPLADAEGGIAVDAPATRPPVDAAATSPPAIEESNDMQRAVRQRLEISAVVGLAASTANSVAFGLVLHARWFWDFFGSWEVPVFFMCSSLALVGTCFWISNRVQGPYKIVAAIGSILAAITPVVIVVLAAIALLLLAARHAFENADMKPRRTPRGRSRKKSRRRHGRW